MKKLYMTFLNEDGSKKTLVIKCVHQDLSPAAVKEAMEQIVELDLFEKDGVRLMTEVHSAKYVEIIETPLFTDSNEMALPIPTPPVEENEPIYEEMIAIDGSGQTEEKQEDSKERRSKEGSTPKKQLAKIYPFMTREEWELKKANAKKNQKRSYSNRQADSAEAVVPLFAPEKNKAQVCQFEGRVRGAPLLKMCRFD